MAIYKVQGPNGEIITIEGPDNADPNLVIAQAQTLYKPKEKTTTDYVKDFGKATASLADTGINAITGMLDYAAYPLARAFGRSPEQATQETTSPKDVIGRGLGITQDPAYQSEASRRLMAGLGQGIENYAVKPLTSATGLPEQDVNSMVGSAMLGAGVKAQPYVNRVGQSVAQGMYAAEPYVTGALKAPIKAPVQFGKGLVEGLVNKEYNPATSAMVPLRETYTPPAAAERFMGQLPGVPQQSLAQLQSQARPTSELVGGTAGRVAQAISPKTLQGETLVPLQGQTMQAFGERVGRGVRTNPLQAMGEVGLTALTGIPFKTLAQGVGELGARYLGAKTGFMPGFSQQVGQAQGRAGIQSQMPQTPLLTNNPTAPGPVNPSTMFVSPEGVAGTNINQVSQAGAQQKYAPQPVAQTPKEMALQKTQEIVNQQAPTRTPQQQAILDQIRARGNNPPVPTTPVTGPIAPTAIQSLSNQRWTPAEKLALERANLQNNPPPAITAADEAAMAKQAIESQKATNSEIISQHAKGNIMGETTSIDTGKDAYNGSRATQGKAKALEKAGVDSLPIVNGMTDAQVIEALHTEMFGKKTKSPFTPEAKTPQVQTLTKPGRFKPDSEISILTKQVNDDGSMVLSGTKNGEPITLEVATTENGKGVKVFDKNKNLLTEYNKNGDVVYNRTISEPKQLDIDLGEPTADLTWAKMTGDRYKQVGDWYDIVPDKIITNANGQTFTRGSESAKKRVVMDKNDVKVIQNYDSELDFTDFIGSSNKGDWKIVYSGDITDLKNMKDPYTIDITLKDGKTFAMEDDVVTYFNPKTNQTITWKDGKLLTAGENISKSVPSADGRYFTSEHSFIPNNKPEITEMPNLEHMIDMLEFPTKTTQAPKTLEEKVDIVKSQGEQRRNQARGKPDVLEMKIDEAPKGKSSTEIIANPEKSKNAFDILKKSDFEQTGTGEKVREWKEGDSKIFEVLDEEYNESILKATSPRGEYNISTMLDDGETQVKINIDAGDHILTLEKSYDGKVNRIYKTDPKTNKIYDNHTFENGKLTVHMGEGKPEYTNFPSINKLNEFIDYIKNGE